MKPDAWREVSQYRIREGRLASGDEIRNNGAFMIPVSGFDDRTRIESGNRTTRTIAVIVSDEGDWDHVSVSLPNRCPTWDEMCLVKDLFFEPHEVAMQLHPAKSGYVNHHPHCLHLWRPHNKSIPLPPSIFV